MTNKIKNGALILALLSALTSVPDYSNNLNSGSTGLNKNQTSGETRAAYSNNDAQPVSSLENLVEVGSSDPKSAEKQKKYTVKITHTKEGFFADYKNEKFVILPHIAGDKSLNRTYEVIKGNTFNLSYKVIKNSARKAKLELFDALDSSEYSTSLRKKGYRGLTSIPLNSSLTFSYSPQNSHSDYLMMGGGYLVPIPVKDTKKVKHINI
ncbi:MAG TPA: hypothetical protein VI564_06110 [Candidatus Nanoarchaeia archaeon]|nr:hypothetical protein [Candidatus Nanoarchaeia archaeon]